MAPSWLATAWTPFLATAPGSYRRSGVQGPRSGSPRRREWKGNEPRGTRSQACWRWLSTARQVSGPDGKHPAHGQAGGSYGEGGIRTLDGRNRPYRFSRPAHSTALPPLRSEARLANLRPERDSPPRGGRSQPRTRAPLLRAPPRVRDAPSKTLVPLLPP